MLGAGGIPLVACESSPSRSYARLPCGPFSVDVNPVPPGVPTMMFSKSWNLPVDRAYNRLPYDCPFGTPRASCFNALLQLPLKSVNLPASPLSGSTPGLIFSDCAVSLRYWKLLLARLGDR